MFGPVIALSRKADANGIGERKRLASTIVRAFDRVMMAPGKVPGTIGLCLLLLLFVAGCASQDLHLWPVVDVEPGAPAGAMESDKVLVKEPPGGSRVQVLWPIFELDTREAAVKHAVRPLYSYDGQNKRGSFLWPIVRYGFAGDTNRYFHLLPLYFKGRKGDRSWHHFFPVAGRFRNKDADLWYVLPYLNRTEGDDRFRGLLLPPLLFGKKAEKDSHWGLVLNYLYKDAPDKSCHFFFPLVFEWSGAVKKPAGEAGDESALPTAGNLFVFPCFYRSSTSDESGQLEGSLYVVPFYGHSWKRQRESRAYGLLPWIDFEGGKVTSLLGWSHDRRRDRDKKKFEAFPFYAGERDGDQFQYEIPGLGLSWWRSAGKRMEVSGPNRGWAWWPLFGRVTGTDEGISQTNNRAGWQALFGLAKYAKEPSRSSLSLLYPFQEISRRGEKRHNRFWPLYRYTADPKKTEWSALAEIVSCRQAPQLSKDLLFLLHPITYQGTDRGDHDFRFFWKLMESRSVAEQSTVAVNPLFHCRSSPEESRFLILSGLGGWGRNGEDRFIRLFWFVDIPL